MSSRDRRQLIAAYPLMTLLLSFRFLKHERADRRLVTAMAVAVGGVILLLLT